MVRPGISMGDKVFTERGWDSYIHKRREDEYDYLIFSLRLVFHGLGSVVSTLFILVKLNIALSWYHYLLIIAAVLTVAFIDKIVKKVMQRSLG